MDILYGFIIFKTRGTVEAQQRVLDMIKREFDGVKAIIIKL
jgi:hypothetical protein